MAEELPAIEGAEDRPRRTASTWWRPAGCSSAAPKRHESRRIDNQLRPAAPERQGEYPA